MKITADNSSLGSYKTGELNGITAEEIDAILGFKSNIVDDPDKVVNSWQFNIAGFKYAVWDYRGSHRDRRFSTYGDATVLRKLFGAAHN